MSRNVFFASRLFVVPLIGAFVAPAAAYADNGAASPGPNLLQVEQQVQQQQQQLNDARRKLGDQLKKLKQQEEALQHQQKQIDALKSALVRRATPTGAATNSEPYSAAEGSRVSSAAFQVPPPAAAPRNSNPAIRDIQTVQAQAQTQSAPVTQTQPQERPQITNISIASQGGVLTPKGVFQFEPTYQYQYASNNEVLIQGLTIVPGITIGTSSVQRLVDRMQTVTFGGRLGITNRLEVEAEVPFVYRTDSTTVTPFSTSSESAINASGKDLGDIQFGAHYQLNSGADGWPYFVANVLVKSNTGRSPFDVPLDRNTGIPTEMNTGTGFWAVQPSITAIYPSDPVVFFANLRYIWNLASTVTLQPSIPANITTPTRATIDPGNGIGGSFGMGFGINERASFSLAYEQTYLMSTSQNGATIPGSTYDIGSFDLGFSYQLNPRTSVNLGVAIGTTKAAPDTAITLRIPIKFQVF